MEERVITQKERTFLDKVFDGHINYDPVRVYDRKHWNDRSNHSALSPGDGNVYFNPAYGEHRKDFGNVLTTNEAGTFVHEMTHIWQEQNLGWGYEARLIYENFGGRRNYNYNEIFHDSSSDRFKDLTLEQQAEFMKDYYLIKNGGTINLDLGNPGEMKEVHTAAEYEEALPDDFLTSTFGDPSKTEREEIVKTGLTTPAGDDNDGGTIGNILDKIKEFIESAIHTPSPLVVDLDGDGIELKSLHSADAVYWDNGGDGFAEASGWVSPDDALLALDKNHDGVINNGTELFGDQTGKLNGFLALSAYDSNKDGKITQEDQVWSKLKLWQDTNGNAYSEASELHTLNELGVTSIDLGYTNVNQDNADNKIYQQGSATINGVLRTVSDVYFSVNNTNSVFDQEYTFDDRAFFLPTLRGYGKMPSLHAAISMDNNANNPDSLISLVSQFQSLSLANVFGSEGRALVRNILYRWAGADGVDPASRGIRIDARELTVLEKLVGQPFLQIGFASLLGITADPRPHAAFLLKGAFTQAFTHIYTNLALQGIAKSIFAGDISYNIATDAVSGATGLASGAVTTLSALAAALPSDAERYVFWQSIALTVDKNFGHDTQTNHLLLSAADYTSLNTAVDASMAGVQTLDGLYIDAITRQDYIPLTGVIGTVGHDQLTATAANQILSGGAGDDHLKSKNGNTSFNNVTFIGGTGDDFLDGGTTNDTYVWNRGDGNDVIVDVGGTDSDKLSFGVGITAADVSLARIWDPNASSSVIGRTDAGDMLITIGGENGGQIIVKQQFVHGPFLNGSMPFGINSLLFQDGTTLNLFTQSYVSVGTEGSDVFTPLSSAKAGISPVVHALAGNDTITGSVTSTVSHQLFGEDGDDTLSSGAGSDLLDGGNGDDILNSGSGNDTMIGGRGDDTCNGGGHDDTFIFGRGDGRDVFSDTGGVDTINLTGYTSNGVTAGGYASSEASYVRIGDDLNIVFDGSNDILIKDYFDADVDKKIENIRFTDDAVPVAISSKYTTATLRVEGSAGNDTLTTTATNHILNGWAGDDTLHGLTGNDTFVYVSGHDVMDDTGGNDTLQFQAGWESGDVTFTRDLSVSSGTVGKFSINAISSLPYWEKYGAIAGVV